MGTRFECVLGAFAHPVSEAQAAAIAEGIERLVLDEHDRLSLFDRGSMISELNRFAAERPVRIDNDLFALLERCERYASQTDRAFDISAGSLMASHGFRPDVPADPIGTAGSYRLDNAARTVHFDQPSTQLDLGGIAKGYVLDLVREELLEHGMTSAIIHGGTSSVTTIGTAPDGSPWRVRLTSDDANSPTIELADVSLACSSPGGRTINGSGHIMDTRTGRPANIIDAACVVGPSAEVCEAWSTALVVDPSLARSLPIGYNAHINRDSNWTSHATSANPGTVLSPEALTHA